MKNKKSLLLLIMLGAVFASIFGASQASAATEIKYGAPVPATWTKAGSPYIISSYVYADNPVTVQPGVVVKFDKPNSFISFTKGLTAIGTENEKIVFTSNKDDAHGGDTNKDGGATVPQIGEWKGIVIPTGASATIENSVFLYGGSSPGGGAVTVYSDMPVSIRNTQIRYARYAGIYLSRDTQPVIENNIISDNNTGIIVDSYSYGKSVKIFNCSLANNIEAIRVYGLQTLWTEVKVDATGNWWGSKTGPYFKHEYYGKDNLGGKGSAVSDGVLFDFWLTKDPLVKRKPVILIPGIGASFNPDRMIGGKISDKWTMLDHTYDGIIEAFKSMDYKEGQDFFIAYYDWRNKNSDSAKEFLAPLICKANALNGTSQVNIVAHSMGGLVARSYVQGDDFGNDVDNLIMIGTPNKGSSDIYPVWEGGYVPKNWEGSFLMRAYVNFMNAKKLTLNNYDTIHNYIPSIKELMPIYDYIHPKDDYGSMKNYSTMNEVNDFLVDLNDDVNLLNQRVRVSIISGNNQPTINRIPTIVSDDEILWTDGKPDPIDPQKNDIAGDGRVLLASSEIASGFKDTLGYNHGAIVTEAEPIIAARLNDELDSVYPAPDISNELGFWFASPVDVEIKNSKGELITSGGVNQMSLAKYAGETNPDGFKIFSIPNPVPGEYSIKITGNGSGEYHIGSEYIDYQDGTNDHSSLVAGVVTTGQVVEYKISYDPEGEQGPVSDIKLKDATPPVINIVSLENKGYLNNQILEFSYVVIDDESGVESQKAFLDGQAIAENKIDLSLLALGKYAFKIVASDKAGNEAEKIVEFNVTTNAMAIRDNITHYFNLGLITDVKTKDKLLQRLIIIQKLQEQVPAGSSAVRAQINIALKDIEKYRATIDEEVWNILADCLNSLF